VSLGLTQHQNRQNPPVGRHRARLPGEGPAHDGQRRTIARVLDDSEDHPDVVELHRRAAAIDHRISLSTVYRTVKLFETEGILERLDFRDGRSRYEQAAREHHDHLINLETGDVIEFRSEDIEALQTEIARRLGYRVVYHRLELYAVPLDKDDP
jgi:Fur family ferric uptake transcriptional regulator